MYHNVFIHASVSGYLGCLHVLAIVNSAATNVGVHTALSLMVFSGYMPSSGVVGSYGLPGSASGKEPACQCRRQKRCEFDSWVGKIPWRRKWQPTAIFLPRESHGQRSLADYSP